MRVPVQTRLTIAAVGFTTLILAAGLLAARVSFVRGFSDYMHAIEEDRLGRVAFQMSLLYEENGGWPQDSGEHFLLAARTSPDRLPLPSDRPIRPGRPGTPVNAGPPPPDAGRRPRPPRMGPPPRRRPTPPPTSLHDVDGVLVAGDELSEEDSHVSVPIVVGATLVGTVRSAPTRSANRPLESAFLREQLRTTVVIGCVAVLAAALMAYLAAQMFVAPIRQLIRGVSELTGGNYSATMDYRRDDEFGDLVQDFNALASTLQQTREARRRMFADISHELRTPLTVLTAEVEAIRDGIRAFNQTSLDSLDTELERLRRLVEDLRAMSTSDLGSLQYRFEQYDLAEVVLDTVQVLKPEGIVVTTRLERSVVRIDRGRIEQLLRNVLMNSISYTARPGRIEVELRSAGRNIVLRVADSAPGVSAEDCQHLFEPLFRVEASRSRASAGSGLGLAICERIVAAHQGQISARRSSLGGLEVVIQLPKGRPS